jgi:hypothetical protein
MVLGGELQQTGGDGEAVLAQHHDAAVLKHGHRQGGTGVADQAEGALHPHGQPHAVHLEAELASLEAAGGLQMARGFGRRQGSHRRRGGGSGQHGPCGPAARSFHSFNRDASR